MRVFEKLFGKDEVPVSIIDDPMLGRLTWSKEDEAWIGTHRGISIALDYERKATPTSAVLDFARDALSDPEWLLRSLEDEKRKWISRVPPSAKDELASLRLGLVSFSVRKGQRFIFGVVEGGGDERSWRTMYRDGKCEGLGFDT
jgi:hypothetical protein